MNKKFYIDVHHDVKDSIADFYLSGKHLYIAYGLEAIVGYTRGIHDALKLVGCEVEFKHTKEAHE